MKYGIFGLGITFLIGAWTALKGIRASREQLLGMAGVIGTKNPTIARYVCWIAFIPLFFGGLGMFAVGGVIVYAAIDKGTSTEPTTTEKVAVPISETQSLIQEKSRAENAIMDGFRVKFFRVPNGIDIKKQSDGSYSGIAYFDSPPNSAGRKLGLREIWDVTATIKEYSIDWTAKKLGD